MNLDYDSSGATLVPGTLRGYRHWQLKQDGTLNSMTCRETWTGPELTAKCLQPDSKNAHILPAPVKDCRCGIYANHTMGPNDYWSLTRDGAPFIMSGYVPGVIEAWGRVRLGSEGFRAEHARVVAIVYQPVRTVTIQEVHMRSENVEITTFEDLRPRYLPGSRTVEVIGNATMPNYPEIRFQASIVDPTVLRDKGDAAAYVLGQFRATEELFLKSFPDVRLFDDADKLAVEFPPIDTSTLRGES